MEISRWRETQPPDANRLRRQMESEGYDVFEWSDLAGTTYGRHRHETAQSHWVISGELELVVDGETYQLRAGDRDFMPANTSHSAFVPGNTPVRYLIGVKK